MEAEFAVSVVVFHTEPETLRKALHSLSSQTTNVKFILVDHSPDNKYKSFLPSNSSWTYLARKNDGYGSGNNAGIASLPQSKFVIIANPDIILPQGTLEKVKSIFENDSQKKIGVLSGKILNPDHSWQNLNKRYPTILGLFGRRFPKLQLIESIRDAVSHYEMSDSKPDLEQDVELLPGCFLCLRRETWERIRGFDPNFFLYFEDYDLCQKVKKIGLKIQYSPNIQVIHEYQRKTHKSIWHFYLFTKSMLQFFNKWGFKWK